MNAVPPPRHHGGSLRVLGGAARVLKSDSLKQVQHPWEGLDYRYDRPGIKGRALWEDFVVRSANTNKQVEREDLEETALPKSAPRENVFVLLAAILVL